MKKLLVIALLGISFSLVACKKGDGVVVDSSTLSNLAITNEDMSDLEQVVGIQTGDITAVSEPDTNNNDELTQSILSNIVEQPSGVLTSDMTDYTVNTGVVFHEDKNTMDGTAIVIPFSNVEYELNSTTNIEFRSDDGVSGMHTVYSLLEQRKDNDILSYEYLKSFPYASSKPLDTSDKIVDLKGSVDSPEVILKRKDRNNNILFYDLNSWVSSDLDIPLVSSLISIPDSAKVLEYNINNNSTELQFLISYTDLFSSAPESIITSNGGQILVKLAYDNTTNELLDLVYSWSEYDGSGEYPSFIDYSFDFNFSALGSIPVDLD